MDWRPVGGALDQGGPIPEMALMAQCGFDVASCHLGSDLRLVTCGRDGNIRIVRVPSGTSGPDGQGVTVSAGVIDIPVSSRAGLRDVRISPGGLSRVAATTDDGMASLWDVQAEAKVSSMVQPTRAAVNVCRFSPDASMLVTAGNDRSVHLWDVDDGKLLYSFAGHEDAISAAEFTPDGRHVLSGDGSGSLRLWYVGVDCRHRRPVAVLDGAHSMGILSLDTAEPRTTIMASPPRTGPDGEADSEDYCWAVSGGYDDHFCVWKVRRDHVPSKAPADYFAIKEAHRVPHPGGGGVSSVRFSEDGAIVAAAGLGSRIVIVTLHATETGQLVKRLEHEAASSPVASLSIRGPLLACASSDGLILVWKLPGTLAGPSSCAETDVGIGREKAGHGPAVEANRRLLEPSPSSPWSSSSLEGHSSDVNGVCFISEGLLVSGSSDGLVKVWSRREEGCRGHPEGRWGEHRVLEAHSYPIYAIACSAASGFLVTTSFDGSIIVWRLETFEKVEELKARLNGGVRSCDISSQDGLLLVTGGGDHGEADFWCLRSFTLAGHCQGHDAIVLTVRFLTPDGSMLATGCNEGDLIVWEVDRRPRPSSPEHSKVSARRLRVFNGAHDLGVFCSAIRFQQNGTDDRHNAATLLTGGADCAIRVWQVFSSSSDLLVSHSVVAHPGAASVSALEGHGATVTGLDFGLGGQVFASSSEDRTVRVWNSASFECIRVFEAHLRYVTCCAFSPSGALLASGSNDRCLKVLSLPPVALGLASSLSPGHGCGHRSTVMPGNPDDLLTSGEKVDPPPNFVCPITQDLMKFPVLCSDGFVYEKSAIEEWLTCRRSASPMTNLPVLDQTLVPQESLRIEIVRHVNATKTKRMSDRAS